MYQHGNMEGGSRLVSYVCVHRRVFVQVTTAQHQQRTRTYEHTAQSVRSIITAQHIYH